MLDPAAIGQKAVKLDLEVANILYVQHKAVIILIINELYVVAIGVLDAIKAAFAFVARITGCLTRFHAPVEAGEGFVQTPQRVLDAGSVSEDTILLTPLAKVRPLTDSSSIYTILS